MPDAAAHPSPRILLWLVAVGFFMQTLDATIVNTALPAGYPLSGTTPEQQFWQRLNLSAAWEMAQKRH